MNALKLVAESSTFIVMKTSQLVDAVAQTARRIIDGMKSVRSKAYLIACYTKWR